MGQALAVMAERSKVTCNLSTVATEGPRFKSHSKQEIYMDKSLQTEFSTNEMQRYPITVSWHKG